jgi:cellulose synthase/poly-beta-1,6-N-acetylglucosamine synthase-like glycosyltransferase
MLHKALDCLWKNQYFEFMIFSIIFIFLLIYFSMCLYLRIGLDKNDQSAHNLKCPFVSVIISARNEQEHIGQCLRLLCQQNYPSDKFEIILIDDNSTDTTLSVARQFAALHDKVLIMQNNTDSRWKSSKKEALKKAIPHAKGNIILMVDADCSPPPNWMKTMTSLYDTTIGLIAGFSPQVSNTNFLWHNFLIIDSMAAAVVAAGSMGWNRGITCTGRNLSFRIQTFQDIDGYNSLPDSVSGDDDFLLQHVAKSDWHIKYALKKDTIIPAQGPNNFFEFIKQKQRHLSSGKFYPTGNQAGFAFFHLSNYVLWVFLFYALWSHNFLFSIPWIIKVIIDYTLLTSFSRKVQFQFSPKAFLPWEGGYFIYHLLASPGAFWGQIKWK